MKRRQVVIVGGGASGLVAAIGAARQGAQVTVLEHKETPGRKILSTGNGRCNLTNLKMDGSCYRGSQPGFPMQVIGHFPVKAALEFFDGLGIVTRERSGYIYPYSDQASAVLDALLMEIRHLGIRIETGCNVRYIRREKGGGFLLETDHVDSSRSAAAVPGKSYRGDVVILAAGSKAAPVTGSDGSGYGLAASLGHRVIEPLPALVQLRCGGKIFKQVAGIRCEARVTILVEGVVEAEDIGELQLTDYGISGIPTFQVSRFAARALAGKKKVEAVVDFLPSRSREELKEWMDARRRHFPDRQCGELMNGVLQKKLSGALLREAGIPVDKQVREVPTGSWRRFDGILKAFCVPVTAANPFEKAQVCCGGVDTREVHGDTMESKLVPGLYLAGELLDVDGICGGYNLQWAWSSGYVAGSHAGAGAGSGSGDKDGRGGTKPEEEGKDSHGRSMARSHVGTKLGAEDKRGHRRSAAGRRIGTEPGEEGKDSHRRSAAGRYREGGTR